MDATQLPSHRTWFRGVISGSLVAGMAAALIAVAPVIGSAAPGDVGCALPGGSAPIGVSTPEDQGLDPVAVQDAINFATSRFRFSVRIYRHNCLVGTGPLDPLTENTMWQTFSATKSVVSMLAGIAYTEGKLDLDAPIGRYLPAELGGDAAHRAIPVRDVLTLSSGLLTSTFGEVTAAQTGDTCGIAMQLPVVHPAGTYFQYSQLGGSDLVSCVVSAAVGEDLQDYAARKLFGPLGIPRDRWHMVRDRAGNTLGQLGLTISSTDFARLGLLLQNGGNWNGQQIISSDYVQQAAAASPANGCYGFLFWTNAGNTCTNADFPSRVTYPHQMTLSAPRDMYAMAGSMRQNQYMIPSLDMTIVWFGMSGDFKLDLGALSGADPSSDLEYEFFRLLMRAVRDEPVPAAGPYVSDPPLPLDLAPLFNPDVFLSGLGLGPFAPR